MTAYNDSPNNRVDKNIPVERIHPVPKGFPGTATDLDSNHMVLAMAYVKQQKWSEPLPCEAGLAKGTIFHELEKPFLGQGGCA